MKNSYHLIAILFSSFFLSQSNDITHIYTDYNDGSGNMWHTGVGNINSVKPDNSHSLLGFQWKGDHYSTGSNDPLLTGSLPSYTALNFQAFPVNNLPPSSSNTYIGVGNMYGGYPGSPTAPIPILNNMEIYLTDGDQGLDMGTAIFNLPQSSNIAYDVVSIAPSSIGDDIPDLLITQMGDPSATPDVFKFLDDNGNTVGSAVNITFNGVSVVGQASWKFYNASDATYAASLQGSRDIRLLAFDWSDFGINTSNIADAKQFVQVFSGTSDPAFTAYNTESFIIRQNVSGFVFNDNNAGIPDGSGIEGVQVQLIQNGNLLGSTTTDNSGAYFFNNLEPGTYSGKVIPPSNFYVVGNIAGNNSDTLTGTITNTSSYAQVNFGINEPPIALNDVIDPTYRNSTISKDIAANDTDPNSGMVIPSSIQYVNLPPGASNISYGTGGVITGFDVPGEGSWLLDPSNNAVFVPEPSFLGNTTTVYYIISDNAGLWSNIANIDAEVVDFCVKPALTITGGSPSKLGITTLTVKGNDWPENVTNGHIVLQSHNKGMVITRVSDDTSIADPKEGMLIYDLSSQCVKLYNGTSWNCIQRKCNE